MNSSAKYLSVYTMVRRSWTKEALLSIGRGIASKCELYILGRMDMDVMEYVIKHSSLKDIPQIGCNWSMKAYDYEKDWEKFLTIGERILTIRALKVLAEEHQYLKNYFLSKLRWINRYCTATGEFPDAWKKEVEAFFPQQIWEEAVPSVTFLSQKECFKMEGDALYASVTVRCDAMGFKKSHEVYG